MAQPFDYLLIVTLLVIAAGALTGTKLFKSTVLFIAFGLFMAVGWVRLDAPDIALAEAAIGAGVTGALVLDAVGHLRSRATPYPRAPVTPDPPAARDRGPRVRAIGTVVAVALFALLARAVAALPAAADGLAPAMRSGADAIGIKNVVTAVLLDFRGYDTLLEIAVLMLATVAVLAVREGPSVGSVRIEERAGDVLRTLTMALLPLMLLVAGHLVWVGSSAPGGAFQAGAVLGAAGIMLALSGYARPHWVGAGTMRAILAVGLLAFIIVAVGSLLAGGALLEYPDERRKALILFIEVLLTLSIGASITSLFLASASGVTDGQKQ